MEHDIQIAAGRHRGFAQIFGLDPRIAFLMFIVDSMLFGGSLLSLGLLVPVSVAAGIGLGFVTYRAQIKWYGDDRESALIKGAIVGLLTAIPTPLPVAVYLPAAVLGMIHSVQRRWASLRR